MSAASGEGGGDGEEDRRLRSLQGLLNFCVENTKSEDAEGATSFTQMDPERKQFLEDVLRSMADGDPVKVMLGLIKVITNDSASTEDKYNALEELLDHCEDLDIANDFDKIGGFQLLSGLLQDPDSGMRWRAADLLAVLVQNNPYWQERALELGLLPQVLTLLDTDTDTMVKVKALYAVSCLTRDVASGQDIFTAHDGFSVVLRAMQSEDDRLQTKAAFMLRAMCVSQPALKDTLCDIGMVEQLVGLLHRDHSRSHEHVMGALLSQITEHARSVQECKRPELGFRKLLEQRLAMLRGKPEYQEEYEHCEKLQQILFGSKSSSASVDR